MPASRMRIWTEKEERGREERGGEGGRRGEMEGGGREERREGGGRKGRREGGEERRKEGRWRGGGGKSNSQDTFHHKHKKKHISLVPNLALFSLHLLFKLPIKLLQLRERKFHPRRNLHGPQVT